MITFNPTNLIQKPLVRYKCIINTEPNNSVQNISQLLVNGKTHQDPQERANVFNNLFFSVSNQVCSGIPRTRKSPLDYLKDRNLHSFYMKPISFY